MSTIKPPGITRVGKLKLMGGEECLSSWGIACEGTEGTYIYKKNLTEEIKEADWHKTRFNLWAAQWTK